VTRCARRLAFAFLPLLAGCPQGDVGAPCNHGDVMPVSRFVSFPSLACDDLLCVYAEEAVPPDIECRMHEECNPPGEEARFACAIDEGEEVGRCELADTFVLERSMCSKKCSSDADCSDGGPFSDVVAAQTSCESGFACARIQSGGDFCCEKLCVCRDDLGVNTALDDACEAGTQVGCCDQSPVPAACGG
jgi:hypothetical protein